MIFWNAQSLYFSECSKDDKRDNGQKVWVLVACGDWRRLWFWDHSWSQEPSIHVFWGQLGYLCLEVFVRDLVQVAPPFFFFFLPSTQDVLLQGLAQERVSRQALYLSFGVSGSHLLTHWESEGFAIDLQAPTAWIVLFFLTIQEGE